MEYIVVSGMTNNTYEPFTGRMSDINGGVNLKFGNIICSGTSWIESEEEILERTRKEKRELREKKIKRIHGPVKSMEADTG